MDSELIDRIIDLVEDVFEKVETLREKVNSILSRVPPGFTLLVAKFLKMWDEAMTRINELNIEMYKFMHQLVTPWVLSEAADKWADVGSKVAACAVEADRGQSEVDYEWKGKAADRYVATLPGQQKALTAVHAKLAGVIGPELKSVANARILFYILVAGAIGTLVTTIVLATGEATSIVGLPAVPPTVIAGAVAAMVAITQAINQLRSAASDAAGKFTTAAGETADFGPANWPSAVAD